MLLEECMEDICNLQQENERLNNIIDELEKNLEDVLNNMYKSLVHIENRGYYSASLVPL